MKSPGHSIAGWRMKYRPVVLEVERKQRWLHEKPHSERLQIGFLESPELKEPLPPFLDIERIQGISFPLHEHLAGYFRNARTAVDIFDIEAYRSAGGNGYPDTTFGVAQTETERRGVRRTNEIRTTIRLGFELDVGCSAICRFRQRESRQSMGYQVTYPILLEVKPKRSRQFLRR